MHATTLRSTLVTGVGLAITVAAVAAPSPFAGHQAPVWRAIIETSVALVGTLVAFLAYGRYRRSESSQDLLIVAAIALMAWLHTAFGVIPDLISPYSVGNGISERIEVWGTLAIRLMALSYLIQACRVRKTPDSRLSARSGDARLLLVPAALALAAASLFVWLVPIGDRGLLEGTRWPTAISSLLQLVEAALFLFAFHRLTERARIQSDPFLGWLGAGCVFFGFAAINYALVAPDHSSWLRSGDLLRAAAVGTWAIGAVWEIRSYWSTIAESTQRETRRQVARDLHDCLAQELALLAAFMRAPARQRDELGWSSQIEGAADRALAEARRAITALASDRPIPLEEDLAHTANSVSSGHAEVRVEAAGGGPDTDPLHRESIVRIVREAVTNAVRHGSASRIAIHVEAEESTLLRISDNGKGFETDDVPEAGRLGLTSMRERAEALGASLTVRSEPGEGTTVEMLWP